MALYIIKIRKCNTSKHKEGLQHCQLIATLETFVGGGEATRTKVSNLMDKYGNGLMKYERSVDRGEEASSCIWENKYIITNKEQFIGTLDESLPCLRIILPNPTETLTVIGRKILNYCSNYGEE